MSTHSASHGTFTTRDQTELYYRAWQPPQPSNHAVILMHRGHEHSGRMETLADELALDNAWAFSYDARGHGRSPGEPGSAPDVHTLVEDLDTFVRFIADQYGIAVENVAIVATSIGAVTTTAWVHDYAPPIRGMVLGAPAFDIKLYVPCAIQGLRILRKVKPDAFIKSYVKPRMLTHDPDQVAAYQNDPLINRQIAVNILLDYHDLAQRIIDDAGAIRAPTCILVPDDDVVVQQKPQHAFFNRLSSEMKELHPLPGFRHAIFHEQERDIPTRITREFLAKIFAKEACRDTELIQADHAGYTRSEYDRLKAPGRFPSSVLYAVQRFALFTLGRLSAGIRTGWRTGFDSGTSLDYVYGNRAQGVSPLGRIIDRGYLNAIGWDGIRVRGQNLKQVLRQTIGTLQQEHRPACILDVASGPGRYVQETLSELRDDSITALLRDNVPTNLEAGRRLAAELDLTKQVRCEFGDAFDADALRAIETKPTIAIVSGLYELFPENAPVLQSLQGIADTLDDDGYLIYTCQPWHPQVEQIARTLTNRDGNPWIMRRRTQAEMDALVRSVGLQKIRTVVGPHGIFTVSIAKKETAHANRHAA